MKAKFIVSHPIPHPEFRVLEIRRPNGSWELAKEALRKAKERRESGTHTTRKVKI